MSITDWPAAERPREKLLAHGAAALSDAELLALFLRVGLPGISAVDLARQLLSHFGSLNALFGASRNAFAAVPGMGDAKYAQLQAVQEMARRALGETLRQTDALTSPEAVRDYLRLWLRGRDIEVFAALFLDHSHRVLAAEELSHGTLAESRVYPRELARRALAHNAAAVIIAHNHPSGSATPSQADELVTRQLRHALELLEIRLLDHFLVAGHEVVSFAERGLL
ncbi:MAG TPA: DNA repair protein RadC [Chitinolyticbacter sp.]|nr:DNA repair protein RadC [Chitinolyticbacter sp.]